MIEVLFSVGKCSECHKVHIMPVPTCSCSLEDLEDDIPALNHDYDENLDNLAGHVSFLKDQVSQMTKRQFLIIDALSKAGLIGEIDGGENTSLEESKGKAVREGNLEDVSEEDRP